jgi:RNA polymerase sigma factor (sigma-70 family)
MARSPENEALLNERIDELQQIVEILKEIRDNPNIGEKKTCDKYGIDFHRFRRYVYDSEWAMKSSVAAESESNKKRMYDIRPTLSWYDTLWMAIMNYRFGNLEAYPSDLEESLDIMIQKLPDREREVILCLYEEGLTHYEAAKRLDITSERVRQLENKAMSKLRRSTGWVLVGKDRVISAMEIQKQIENDIAIRTKHEVIMALDDKVVSLRKIIKDCTNEAIKKFLRPVTDLTIEELDFSDRTYEVLKRAGINTVDDIRKRSVSDFEKVRNMGRRSLNEIMEKMTSLGFELRKEEET